MTSCAVQTKAGPQCQLSVNGSCCSLAMARMMTTLGLMLMVQTAMRRTMIPLHAARQAFLF